MVLSPKRPVIFECVGVPGLLQQILAGAPLMSRIVVVGHTPLEFRDTLRLLAEGKVNGESMITGVVGLSGVAAAFDALKDPDLHAKILIDPSRESSLIQTVH